ncbi:hypothetical protein VDBG_07397 [Verticillium alfalfae VaMs.102]|uniref:Uncharacterized protein n=1 Tax=Verticillium alfalfae (strain VaMs.102 / ATCC MYA-4576 / FGSC 10136) TaxID=526221 RepID=C9SR12_VERA1|nr:hypothetical protein VDBG_07397 [Verticillium alfalfae VaMs.102]EEY21287.1 hypothetical protein VDBG_07397 [Verticillium alfalfae VaMs.102]
MSRRSRTKDKEGPQGINYVQFKKRSIEEEDSRSGRSETLHGDGAPAAVRGKCHRNREPQSATEHQEIQGASAAKIWRSAPPSSHRVLVSRATRADWPVSVLGARDASSTR